MTRVYRDFRDTMQREVLVPVSADVIFASSRFPNYKIGANNNIVEVKEYPTVSSMKEVVARETAQLLGTQKRLSVRDLASKFEKGLAAAAKLSDEVCLSTCGYMCVFEFVCSVLLLRAHLVVWL